MQERNGYFFCLEDRAIFCRQCDVSTHKGSPYLASHQRFLIAGMKVSLHSINESTETGTLRAITVRSRDSADARFLGWDQSTTAKYEAHIPCTLLRKPQNFMSED